MKNPVCPLRAGGDIAGRGSLVRNATEWNESANGATRRTRRKRRHFYF